MILQSQASTIKITVDKSHLITIGEKLYSESLELVRELVCNAYDADATNVWIEVAIDKISVKDDGVGMDEGGLKQFFTIGSEEKKFNPKSQIYKRDRIGQFGIGKFAVFSACNCFRLISQKDNFAAEIIFDKAKWGSDFNWEIPIRYFDANVISGNGTTVILENLTKNFTIPQVERHIRERVPLKAPNFKVFLNGKQIEAISIPGRRFPINLSTEFGKIIGEAIVPFFKSSEKLRGIECTVKGVMITREMFGAEMSHNRGMQNITGTISADFVPITSSRSSFVNDSLQYQIFYMVMEREIRNISKIIAKDQNIKEDKKTDEQLKESLIKVRKALKQNPYLAPEILEPMGQSDENADHFNSASFAQDKKEAIGKMNTKTGELIGFSDEMIQAEGRLELGIEELEKQRDEIPKKIRAKDKKGREVIARKISIGNFGVICKIEYLGKNEESLLLYLTTLITQEIVAMQNLKTPREAFDIQNRLLTDALG